MNNPATIDIIIVTYNCGSILQKCLDSIYAQRHQQLNIIIIDGASTDGTVDIIKANETKLGYWESAKDDGIYDAMNKAVTHLTGNWVYFMGADDELLPEFSDMAEQLTDLNAIYYANVLVGEERKLGELSRYQFAKYGPYHQAMIYPASVFKIYRYDTRYKISADFDLTLRLAGDKKYHFVYKDFAIAKFNDAGTSGTNVDWPFQKAKPMIVLKNFGLITYVRYLLHKRKNKHNPRA